MCRPKFVSVGRKHRYEEGILLHPPSIYHPIHQRNQKVSTHCIQVWCRGNSTNIHLPCCMYVNGGIWIWPDLVHMIIVSRGTSERVSGGSGWSYRWVTVPGVAQTAGAELTQRVDFRLRMTVSRGRQTLSSTCAIQVTCTVGFGVGIGVVLSIQTACVYACCPSTASAVTVWRMSTCLPVLFCFVIFYLCLSICHIMCYCTNTVGWKRSITGG